MRTFAQKLEAAQQTTPAKTTIRDRASLERSHEAGSILGLQGTIGNRALQRMLQTRTEEPESGSASLEPGAAHFEARGAGMQEERSAALQRGVNPGEPANKPADPVEEALREANNKPLQPPAPEPTLPGDPIQQAHAIPTVHPDEDLWPLPRIQDGLRAIAEETEARERASLKPGETAHRTVANQMEYWEQRFFDSVNYILYRRGGGKHNKLRKQLRAEEERLMQSVPRSPSSRSPQNTQEVFREMGRNVALIAKVEALRRTYTDKWQQIVDRTADQFVTLASNQARFLTVNQATNPVSIYGIPEYIEGTVEAAAHQDTLTSDSTPVAPSVITFMKAVQRESGLKARAGDYGDHEKHSPYLGNIEGIGKYSFDVDLEGLIKINAEGFYEREPLIKFFEAVDRAATATGIGWIALYNDFEVARTVNERLTKRRIGFSGMGNTKDDPGSIHHGPAPYLLHVHFNIMPALLAAQYIAGKGTPPYIDLSNHE